MTVQSPISEVVGSRAAARWHATLRANVRASTGPHHVKPLTRPSNTSVARHIRAPKQYLEIDSGKQIVAK